MANEGSTKPTELEWKRGLLHQVKFLGPDECVHCGKKLTTDHFEDLCEPRVESELARVRGLLQRLWISVEERLPSPYEDILAWSPDCGVHVSLWTDENWVGDSDTTHWMPLPEPPNMEKEIR